MPCSPTRPHIPVAAAVTIAERARSALPASSGPTGDLISASGSRRRGERAIDAIGASPVAVDALVRLTERETAVLDLVAAGLITVAIARRLGISPRTVAKHLEQAYRKLGANNRVSAVLRANSLGLIPSQPTRT
jgi:DNA-binding CsgD family transcriptional regulator